MTNKNTKHYKILSSVLALAALILTTGIVAALVARPAAAQNTSIPTTTHQIQTCDTAGSASSISISCNGTFNNNIANAPNPPGCPTGYTLSQGQCTAQPTCASGATPNSLGQCIITTVVGQPTCSPGFSVFVTFFGTICRTVNPNCPPGSHHVPSGFLCQSDTTPVPACISGILNPSTNNCEITTTPAICPGGITPTNGQCITKPS